MKPRDENLHTSLAKDPSWREGYYFSGYDPRNEVALSISIGIRPIPGVREEIVTVHSRLPLTFLNRRDLEGDDALQLGSLKIEPLVPFEEWRIQMRDSFRRTEGGTLSNVAEEVSLDLQFEALAPPLGYSTARGERYEQPGSLQGRLQVGKRALDFEGTGIRDHSWEARDFSRFGEWYNLFGWFESGEAVNLVSIEHDGEVHCDSWVRTGRYDEVRSLRIEPTFSGDVLERSRMVVETREGELQISSRLISCVFLPLGDRAKVVETLVELGLGAGRGYGFLWYGR